MFYNAYTVKSFLLFAVISASVTNVGIPFLEFPASHALPRQQSSNTTRLPRLIATNGTLKSFPCSTIVWSWKQPTLSGPLLLHWFKRQLLHLLMIWSDTRYYQLQFYWPYGKSCARIVVADQRVNIAEIYDPFNVVVKGICLSKVWSRRWHSGHTPCLQHHLQKAWTLFYIGSPRWCRELHNYNAR